MTKYFTIILLVIISFKPDMSLSQSRVLRPLDTRDKIIVIEKEKQKKYYLLNHDVKSVLLIKGPGKLRLTTRALLKEISASTEYNILYNIDGGKETAIRFTNTGVSKKDKFRESKNGIPGLKKYLSIELSPGEHTLEFHTGNSKVGVAVRYEFKKVKEKKVKWVMLSPVPPNDPVDLVTHENVVHYFRFSQKKPLKIKINGPTSIRILTRFENHFSMKGRINYRLQLRENGKIIHTYLLNSVFSDVTTYKNEDDKMPGKAKEFFIEVPGGNHTYTIITMDKDKNTILARVLFPKKDVKLEE